MDFITGLPCIQHGYDLILVTVDQLTKVAHFSTGQDYLQWCKASRVVYG
jgi:hypothetical protein